MNKMEIAKTDKGGVPIPSAIHFPPIGVKLPSSLNSSTSSCSLSSMTSSSDEDLIPRFGLDEVEEHDDPSSCWIIIIDFVFDVSKFIRSHPGGAEVMLENAGRDATGPVLDETSHSPQALKSMKRFCIGMLEKHECHDRVYQKHHQEFYTMMLTHLESQI